MKPRTLVLVVVLVVVLGLAAWRKDDIVKALEVLQGEVGDGDFKPGRTAFVDTIVLHSTEGGPGAAEAAAWWKEDPHHASAHYVIGQDGAVLQAVDLADTAYHAGNADVNARSVGIELAGHGADPSMYTAAMMDSLVALVKQLRAQYQSIPLAARTYPGILAHADVPDAANPELRGGSTHHTDPESFPWSTFMTRLGVGGFVS